MFHFFPTYFAHYNALICRHNAQSLNDIALEFILNNLQDLIIIDGLSVSEHDFVLLCCMNCANVRLTLLSFHF